MPFWKRNRTEHKKPEDTLWLLACFKRWYKMKEGLPVKRFYEKSQLWFALVWIIVYVVGTSAADGFSRTLGLEKCVTLPWLALLSAVVLIWLKRQGLWEHYGLCRSGLSASHYLYYLPLAALCTCNLWGGLAWNGSVTQTLLSIGSMLCVGLLEELIFRGFLFRAMARDGVRAAVIVSSLTFGLGHLVNLINGSGASLLASLCQVCYAVTFGYLCVILFYRGGSLLPCIAAHCVINATSVFADEAAQTPTMTVISGLILTLGALAYALVLRRTLPQPADRKELS